MAGWGGARVGAGAKPKPKPDRPASPFAVHTGGRPDSAQALARDVQPPPAVPSELFEPPADLSEGQQEFWRQYAPLAVERKTLTPATVPAFRLLCELHAKKDLVGTMVDKGALGGLRVFMQLAKQVETLMARFCLAPFGKPTTSDKPKVASNPFAGFAAK